MHFLADGTYESDKQTVQISSDVNTAFNNWKSQNSQNFGADDQYKLQVFNQNYQKVNSHQQDPSRTFDMALNQFAALTKQEFISIYLGTNPADNTQASLLEESSSSQKIETAMLFQQPPTKTLYENLDSTMLLQKPPLKHHEKLLKHQRSLNEMTPNIFAVTSQKILPTTGLPSSVDWRTKGAVTPVKDQGNCGSCWSFSATGAMESLSFISGRGLPSLSEQQLVDCSGSYGNYGCGGGLMDNAFRYVRDKGITTEKAYAYTATDQSCKATCGYYKISGYNDVPAGIDLQLAAAINQQPVSVAVDASNFQFYSSGVFNYCANSLNHGILAVGYTSSYWIVKNSWSAGWGESGYIRMSRGNTCGILNMASYPIA